jgi:hypothetical protein
MNIKITLPIYIHTRGPETDMSRPRIEPGPPRWEASSLEKIHSNILLIATGTRYLEHLPYIRVCDCMNINGRRVIFIFIVCLWCLLCFLKDDDLEMHR